MDFKSALQAHEHSATLQDYIRRLYKLQDIDPDLRDAADDWLSSEIAQIEREMKIHMVSYPFEFSINFQLKLH